VTASYTTSPDVTRRTVRWLTVATVGCAALVVFFLTPYGGQVQEWILD
jgi:hypothetical protein